jgi:hypothetical protein
MAEVFISYSRLDKVFVHRLGDGLVAHKREAWIDWKDIPLTAEWQQEIFSNIEAADNFIFIISPDSIASTNCKKEIDHAVITSEWCPSSIGLYPTTRFRHSRPLPTP